MSEPTPNTPLTQDDVKLLRKGDAVVDIDDRASACAVISTDPLMIQDLWGRSGFRRHEEICFLGRPGPDGFIPHDGGPNPAPGLRVDVRQRGYADVGEGYHADEQEWDWDEDYPAADITHWRPHVPAPAGEAEECEACHGSGIRPTADGVGHYCDCGRSVPAPPQPKGEVEAAVANLADDVKHGRIKNFGVSRDVATLLSALTASQARESRAVAFLRSIVETPHDDYDARASAREVTAALATLKEPRP